MLSIEKLNAGYGKSGVLNDLSLTVAAGEVVCILGRNGMGKTTTLRTIMGLTNYHSGRITFDSKCIERLPANRIARLGLGYVPQGRQIFAPMSVLENLKLACHSHRFSPDLLELAVAHFPILKERLAVPAGSLSGGEQQMLAIGRVLINRPRVMLFDEPTEGLMPSFVSWVARTILDLKAAGVAVLLVEQNLHLALETSDRILFMHKGTIEFSGTAEEASDDDILARYLGVTTKGVKPWDKTQAMQGC